MRFTHNTGFLFLIATLLLFISFSVSEKAVATVTAEPLDSEEIEKNLELPDIYENTIIYNGTVNPELSLRVHLPGEDNVVSPYVNEDGQFSVNLATSDSAAGDEILFILGMDGKEPGERTIDVQPDEVDKEVVKSSADTSAVEQIIIDGTTITWPENVGYVRMDVETIGDELEGPLYYAREGESTNEDRELEYLGETNHTARIAMAEDLEEANAPNFPKPGDKVILYITALGVTAELESEIPSHLDAWFEDEKADQEDSSESTDNNKEDTGESSSDNISTEEEENNITTGVDSDENGTENHGSPNTVETDSAVSESNTSGGIISPVGWVISGILIVAILICGIIWFKKRKTV